MARPIWSGNPTFGLVAVLIVPVVLHAAASGNTARFCELERGTRAPRGKNRKAA
jgi:non-homologous end joining protein Ku